MSTGLAIAPLAISSLLVALLSDFVADSVDVVKQSLGWTDLSDGSDRNRCGHERGAWGLYRAAGADIARREEVRGSLWRLSFGDASNLGSARWFRLVSSGCPPSDLDGFHAIAHAVAVRDRIASLLNNAAC